MEDLYQKLLDYASGDAYPFHMPGHKRQALPVDRACSIDITEIDGFDDLHHPEGILLGAMEEAAILYGSRRTFFLVNGSSCGILAALSALVPVGGKVLLARNCHTSAHHALLLRHLRPVYVLPELLPALGGLCGAVKPESVEQVLRQEPDVRAVMIVSPTYEGIVSDVAGIAAVCHAHGVVLIVDEAHGAHFSFGKGAFPPSALTQGADVVIQSLHKTLPSMTQTAVLHIARDARVEDDMLAEFVGMFQSTSPSYVLMASIIACLRQMQAEPDALSLFAGRFAGWREKIAAVPGISLLGEKDIGAAVGYDASKLVFAVRGMSGKDAQAWLREYAKLELEMAAPNYALAMTSLCDTEEGFMRLFAALEQIPKDGDFKPVRGMEPTLPPGEMPPWQVRGCKTKVLPVEQTPGYISAETVYLYPPGIPYLTAGERVTEAVVRQLIQAEQTGFEVRGDKHRRPGTLRIVAE